MCIKGAVFCCNAIANLHFRGVNNFVIQVMKLLSLDVGFDDYVVLDYCTFHHAFC